MTTPATRLTITDPTLYEVVYSDHVEATTTIAAAVRFCREDGLRADVCEYVALGLADLVVATIDASGTVTPV